MGKVMRHTLGASLNIRHNLSSSKGPKPLQLKLLTTYIPKTSAFTLAFSTSQRLRTTRASARTFFTFRHYITPSARALLQRIFLMSSLMLLLVWLIFFMVLIKLLPILGTISGKTVKLMVLALICLGNNRQD